MKIVVSGSAGIGKTTLINHIAHTINHVIIPDFIDDELAKRGLTSPKQLTDELAREVRLAALERKIKVELSTTDFISDKGVVDYYSYWLAHTSKKAPLIETQTFFERMRTHSRLYDKVIIPRFGRLKIEDNNKRSINPYQQQMIHILIKGFYADLGIPFIEYSWDLERDPEQIARELEII